MKFTVQMLVEGLNAYQVVDKLAREKITVYSAIPQKNAITLEVARKDYKKVFAILQSSCYNIKKVSPYRWTRILEWGKRSVGLFVGTLVALLLVVGAQTRVLDVRIVGSGRYYEREIRRILLESDITLFSVFPSDVSAATMKILSLPRVSYCNVAESGGIVTVEVQVSDEAEPIQKSSLLSPVSGVVETLVVVRGNALVQIGDEVTAGQTVVDCNKSDGTGTVIVVAFVRIVYPVSVFYRSTEREALAQAYLQYGQIESIATEREGDGYRITGTAFCEASCHMD